MISEFAAIVIVSVAVMILWQYRQWRYSPLFRIPGPKCNFTFQEWIVGVFRTLQHEPFMQPFQRWWNEAGPSTQMLHFTGLFGRHVIVVLDPDGVKQILSAKANGPRPRFLKGLGFDFGKKVIGNGLVTINGDEWQRHRKVMQPLFDNQVLKDALNSCLPKLIQRFVDAWKENEGGEIDITSHFSALTLDIIGKVGFAHDFQAVKSVEQWSQGTVCQVELNDPIIKSLYSSMKPPSMARLLIASLHLGALERFLTPDSYNARVLLDREFAAVVDRSYARSLLRDAASMEPKCLLDHLIDAQPGSPLHPSLTHKDLQGEMKTLIIAGHETTATLCVWAIYCLIKHKEVDQRVLDDIMKHSSNDDRLTFESVEKMEYFDAFLKESLRLYPPIGQIFRTTMEWTNILGENIPPNTRIAIPIHLLHRHPQYWIEPDSFKPERWIDTAENSNGRKFRPFSYLPFSAGPRSCIGQRFAMWEAKFILASIIREFDMEFSPSFDDANLKLVSFISTKSNPAITIRARPRSATAKNKG